MKKKPKKTKKDENRIRQDLTGSINGRIDIGN